MWSNDSESHAGSSLATDRASHAGQVKDDDPDKKRYPGLPGWGLDRGADVPTSVKMLHCPETHTAASD